MRKGMFYVQGKNGPSDRVVHEALLDSETGDLQSRLAGYRASLLAGVPQNIALKMMRLDEATVAQAEAALAAETPMVPRLKPVGIKIDLTGERRPAPLYAATTITVSAEAGTTSGKPDIVFLGRVAPTETVATAPLDTEGRVLVRGIHKITRKPGKKALRKDVSEDIPARLSPPPTRPAGRPQEKKV